MNVEQLSTHRVWHLGAGISTDDLAPGHAMKHGLEVIARHCLETVNPDFAAQVKPGDVIIAGSDFGVGSSREQAAQVLVKLGIRAVIAPSFSGLFFRNAFNVGLLLLTCSEAHLLSKSEHITLDLSRGIIIFDQKSLKYDPIPDFLMEMVKAGGLLNLLKAQRGRANG